MKTAFWLRGIATMTLIGMIAAFAAGCEWPWDDDDDDKDQTEETTENVVQDQTAGTASMTVLVKRGN